MVAKIHLNITKYVVQYNLYNVHNVHNVYNVYNVYSFYNSI